MVVQATAIFGSLPTYVLVFVLRISRSASDSSGSMSTRTQNLRSKPRSILNHHQHRLLHQNATTALLTNGAGSVLEPSWSSKLSLGDEPAV